MKTMTAKTYEISLDWTEVNTLRSLAKRCAAKYENTLSTISWAKDAAALEEICGKIEKIGRNEYRVELTWEEAEEIRGLAFTCSGQYHVFNAGTAWLYDEHTLEGITRKAEDAGFDTFDEN